ncbi:MAG: hypothetical protein IPJ82_20500 [Lewinellaceae bacterium]|nr:hypothetical protein [Lewinellaceae bacterium]
MRQQFLLFFLLCVTTLSAQTGCPGCAVDLPAGLAADTLYLQSLSDGEKGKYYDRDLSFRMPKTTTPVYAIDSTTLLGFTISKIEIISIDGVPPGLHWQPNQWVFETATQTDGCVKFCGTPSVSDSFVMTVKIRATVLFIVQEATFPLKIYIAPKVSTTEGFTMTNGADCGSTTVSFENNIPSGGLPGFTYEWDFGDGTTFTGENPPPHTYNVPGMYPVTYHATVDTAGFVLESITVLGVDCVDQLGVGAPDLYLLVNDPVGTELFDSSPDVDNTPLPYNFPVNLKMENGNYTLAVWDEDSGLKGSDDACGTISFNILSGDTLVSGGLTVILNIVHDVDEINSTDTVYVYPQPAEPFVVAPEGLTACEGSDTLLLVSSSGAANQWWYEGEEINGAVDFIYEPTQSGYYQIQVNGAYGCSAISDSVLVQIFPAPAQPVYVNVNNSLRLVDTTALPPDYSLQWYNGNDPIPGETGFRYCATSNGNYGLLVTDNATGCTSFYATPVIYDPNFDCTIGTNEASQLAVGIVPNPASESVRITFGQLPPGGGQYRVWDVTGRLINTGLLPGAAENLVLPCYTFNTGVFTVEVLADGIRGVGKLVVVR